MKSKLLFSFASIMMVCAGILLSPSASAFHLVMQDEEIIIYHIPEASPGGPRTPVFNPFYAEQEGTYVLLGSSSSYGEVSVTLSSTAGDYYQTVFDTEDGYILIPISGDPGNYTLTLVAENGQVYEGRFVL